MLRQHNHYAPCFAVDLNDAYPNEGASPTWYTDTFAAWLGPGPNIEVEKHSDGNWTIYITLPPPSRIPDDAKEQVRALVEEVADAWRQNMLAVIEARMADGPYNEINQEIRCASMHLVWAPSWIDFVLRPFLEPHYGIELDKEELLHDQVWIKVTLRDA